jgi:hypothetical protein
MTCLQGLSFDRLVRRDESEKNGELEKYGLANIFTGRKSEQRRMGEKLLHY